MTAFDITMDFVLAFEGGYVFDPHDPGGETNLGVTDMQDGKVDHMVDVNGDGSLMVPIKDLTKEQAKVVYKRKYWNPMHGDELPGGVALILVDTAINMGVRQATKIIQKVSGLTVDGVYGPKTLEAAKVLDVEKYGEARLAIYQQLKGWPRYGKGWARRNESAVKTAKGML